MDEAEAIKILEDYKIFDSGGMSIKEIDECKKHNKAIDFAIEALKSKPPKGKWIFNPKDAIDLMFTKPKCPNCGFESADGRNFCPNCGCDCRGDKE